MSEKTPHRRPATFKLDDPGVIVMGSDETGRPARGTVMSGSAAAAAPAAEEAVPAAVALPAPEADQHRTATPDLESAARTTSTGFALPLVATLLAGALLLAVRRMRSRVIRSR